ncbi:hypothetical protein NC796_20470 [Aliifodinibius sp. S!AR15-10]|uniref:hypothetical protein n=1 Tax=Aliifodinibius sp. S!AR15-10 TaxID=2950437 RepID=UPI0028664BF7|nr:hypothetical protein [Aliifodinibius sp. S!AR15-10]MDR8393541.1 hypothetical protein [Aliifodinibius sp. S!AR15-10]
MKKRIFTYLLTAVVGIFMVSSCNDNPSSSEEGPPDLPPAQSMDMGFTEFEQFNDQQEKSTASTNNISRAFVTATVLKAIVDVNLAIPRALLLAAENSEAELNGDGEWEWSYSKTEGEHNYNVTLLATREGDDSVQWNFYVTNSPLGLDNALFFSGETNEEGDQGTWTYYNLQNPGQEEEVSTVSWTIEGEEELEIRLDVTSDRNDNLGDYITYSSEGEIKTAVYFDASDDEITELQFNADNYTGYIIAPNYNNGEKACWNSALQDVACE